MKSTSSLVDGSDITITTEDDLLEICIPGRIPQTAWMLVAGSLTLLAVSSYFAISHPEFKGFNGLTLIACFAVMSGVALYAMLPSREIMIFNSNEIRVRGKFRFFRRSMRTANIKGFVLRRPTWFNMRQGTLGLQSYRPTGRVFLFATAEKNYHDEKTELANHSQFSSLEKFLREDEHLFSKRHAQDLAVAIQATKSELQLLQNILSEHLKKLRPL